MKKFNEDLEKLLNKIGETLSSDNSVVVKIEKGVCGNIKRQQKCNLKKQHLT